MHILNKGRCGTYSIDNNGRKHAACDRGAVFGILCRAGHGVVVRLPLHRIC